MKIENITISNVNLDNNSAKLTFNITECTKGANVYLKINESDYINIYTNKTNGTLTYNLTNLRRGVNNLFLKLISSSEEYITDTIVVKIKENGTVKDFNCKYTDSTGKYILEFLLSGDTYLKYSIDINIDNTGYKQIYDAQIVGIKTYEGKGLSLGTHKCKIRINDGYDSYETSEYTFNVTNHKPLLSDLVVTDIKNNGNCSICYGVKDIETQSLSHSLTIDNNKRNITPTKTNDFYSYSLTGLGVGKHTLMISVSDGKDTVNTSTVTIEIFQSSTSNKRLLEIAKIRYDFSYQQLKRIIETTISDNIFNYETENETIIKSQNYYKEMYSEFNRVSMTSIDIIGNKKITNAKADLNNEINDVYNAVDTLENTMETTFKDGILSDSERDSLRNTLNLVAKEKVDIDKDYTNLYNNADLTGNAKSNLKSTYDTFVSRHNTLTTTVNDIINKAGIVDNTDKSNLDTAFTNWRTALGNYRDASMKAIDAIARKKVDDNADIINKYWSEIILEEGGIQSRVGSLESKVVGVGGIEERLRSAEQKITTDGITNLIKDEFYSKEAVDNKLAKVGVDIEIGGRNLLRNSKTNILNSSSYIMCSLYFGDEVPIDGEQYTISIKGTLASTKTAFRVFNSGGTVHLVTLSSSINKIYSATFTWKVGDTNNTYIEIYQIYDSEPGVSSIEWVKLEKGNIATGWTPAPEDAEIEIETVKSSVAEHTTALNNITSRVSTTEKSIETINGNIVDVTERVSTTEQKITDDAITNVVSKTFYTKKQIDDIEIGGRNLLPFSRIIFLRTTKKSGTSTKSITFTTADKYGGIGLPSDLFIPGEKYVLSYDLTLLTGDGTVGGHAGATTITSWYINGVKQSISYKNGVPWNKNVKAKVEIYYTALEPSTVIDPILYIQCQRALSNSITMDCLVENIKVEKGDKVTDWTPAPEDIEEKVETLSSEVNQTVNEWSATIKENGEEISKLKLTSEEFGVEIKNKADSSNIISKINASTEGITISSSKINISGFVTFSDLSTSGKTTINGSNIKTGTIDASKATITNINASNIKTGTLSGNLIQGGTIKGVTLQTYADSTSKGVIINKESMYLNGTKFLYKTSDNFRIASDQTLTLSSPKDIYLLAGLSTNESQTGTNNVVIPSATLRTQELLVINDTTIQGACAVSKAFSCASVSCVGSIAATNGFSSSNGGLVVTGSITTNSGNINATAGQVKSKTLSVTSSSTLSGNVSCGGNLTASAGTITAKALKSTGAINCASFASTGDASFGNNVWIKYLYVNGTWVSSDKRKKMDIRYVDKDEQTIAESGLIAPNVNINKNDMHEFIEALPIASYRYIDDVENKKDVTHYGLVVQDVLYTKVGSELVKVLDDEKQIGDEDDYMGYSQEKLLTFMCGALQKEIELRKELEKRIEELENKSNK